MNKQTNLHSIKLLSLAMVAAMAIIIGTTFSAAAQDQSTFNVGDTIEVQSNGAWSKARILEAKDGSYRITYPDKTYHYDEWVRADRMRSVGETAPANKQTNTTTANQTNNDYKVGDRVEADPLWIGKWYKGTIVSITNDNGLRNV